MMKLPSVRFNGLIYFSKTPPPRSLDRGSFWIYEAIQLGASDFPYPLLTKPYVYIQTSYPYRAAENFQWQLHKHRLIGALDNTIILSDLYHKPSRRPVTLLTNENMPDAKNYEALCERFVPGYVRHIPYVAIKATNALGVLLKMNITPAWDVIQNYYRTPAKFKPFEHAPPSLFRSGKLKA